MTASTRGGPAVGHRRLRQVEPRALWPPDDGDVRLFTVIATLGAPLEVTAANLAIETFLPADAESAERLKELAETAAAPSLVTSSRS